MRTVNTRVNEMVDLKDYLQMTPTNLWVKDLKWWITDHVNTEGKDVAAVNDGVVLGLNEGTATLHVSNHDGSAETTLPIKVQAKRYDNINLSRIELNKTSNVVERGEEFTLSAKLMPFELFPEYAENFANYNLRWTTSGGAVKFVVKDDQGNETLTDEVVGAMSVTVRSFRTGSAMINVIDTLSTARVNSNCSVRIKSEFDVDGGYLKSYTGRGDENGVVEIPNDLSIVYIYPYAFMNNPYITKIVFPEGILQIMETAVYGCDNLREVVVPSTCNSIGKWSFGWNTKLEKVTFNKAVGENGSINSVKSIGELAFVGCGSLTDIDFSGVYSIGPRAFAYCESLHSIDLTNVKSMGEQAFYGCEGLTEIKTGRYTPIGEMAFVFCTGLTELTINGTSVGDAAFGMCTNLQKVTFTNAVDTIGSEAFYGCERLSELNFRSTVRVIGSYAFANCAFNTIVIPNGVETIGNVAFGYDKTMSQDSGPTEVIISAGAKLTSIGASIFRNCHRITAINVESDNAYLSSNKGILYDKAQRKVLLVPFAYGDTELTLPSTVTEIGDYAFAISSITTVNGVNVTKIGNRAFDSSAITTVNFGNVSYIGDFAFFDTPNFTAWPECFRDVSHIGDFAFMAYTKEATEIGQTVTSGILGTVTLNKVSYLGACAFANDDLSQVVINSSNLKEIGESAFDSCRYLATVVLPLDCKIEKIGNYAFRNCAALTQFDMPDSVTSVGEGAFLLCTKLSSVTLSANITAISDLMFANCSALTKLDVPAKVTYIGDYAFAVLLFDNYGNVRDFGVNRSLNLTGNALNNVTYIGDYAFYGVIMSNVSAPNLLYVGESAFEKSQIANSVNIPSVITLGDSAFYGSSVSRITLDSVVNVGKYALAKCENLSGTLELPEVVNLGAGALYGDKNIRNVAFGPLETIGSMAFAGTRITELRLPVSLKQIDVMGLYGAEYVEKINISNNPTYFTDSYGVLYKRLPSGLYSLVYYPVAVKDNGNFRTSYTADPLTVKVEAYAFAGSVYLTHITLPERLRVLGAGAFYDCRLLQFVTLNCAAAPVLEMIYDGDIENHYYDTFENNTIEHKSTVTIRYPKNGTGYDTYNWRMYFNEDKKNIEVMTTNSRTQTTIDTADALQAMDINALTLDDISRIVLLRRIYASLSADQIEFLRDVEGKLLQAEMQIAKLLNVEMAALPKKVTVADREQIERLRILYDMCNSQIQSQVTNLNRLTEAEAKLAALTDGGEKNNAWMLPTFLSIGAVLVVGAAVAVTLVLVKRKKTSAKQTKKEGKRNEE